MREAQAWLRRAHSAIQEARSLADAGFPAASISRSYYAMFYGARALLSTRGLSPKTHGGTLQMLGEAFVKPGLLPSEMTAAMGAAMELREQADYEVEPSGLDSPKAQQVLGAAREFVDRVDTILRAG